MIFVDSSALTAYLGVDQAAHAAVRSAFTMLVSGDEALLTTNYVILETSALAQRRRGMDAVRVLHNVVAPLLTVQWVEPDTHEAALATYLAANRRRLSLVDFVSFEVMRRRGIDRALALDEDFRAQGFELLPG